MLSNIRSSIIKGNTGIRYLSSSRIAQGKIKKVLNLVAEGNIDPRKVHQKFKEEKLVWKPRKVKAGEERKVASLRTQKIASILSKRLGEKVDYKKLGPTSNEDLKYFQYADKKMLYRLLGVSEAQIQDSVVVTKTVKAFLNRNQGEKALSLAKLAGENGTVAMNFIISHYIRKGEFNNALDLHVYRKKWGVKVNEYSLTMLFNEFTNYKSKEPLFIGKNQGERLKNFYFTSTNTKDYKPNMIHFNSCLTALSRCVDQSFVFEVLDRAEELEMKLDTKTFTAILQGLSFSKDDVFAIGGAEYIYEKLLKVPEHELDHRVWESLARVFITRERSCLIKKGIHILQKCFNISQDMPRAGPLFYPETKSHEQLEVREFYPLDNKLEPRPSTIDVAMLGAVKIRNSKLALKFFEEFERDHETLIDIGLFHRYLDASQSSDPKNAGEISVKLYKTMAEDKKFKHLKPTDWTKEKVFKGFILQAKTNWEQKWQTNRNLQKARNFFKFLEAFMVMVENPPKLPIFKGYLNNLQYIKLEKDEAKIVEERFEAIEDFYTENKEELNARYGKMVQEFASQFNYLKQMNKKALIQDDTPKFTKKQLDDVNLWS